ncbi:MAG: RlmF-related methyltransferase, partial [Bacteroidaceae bacterium]
MPERKQMHSRNRHNAPYNFNDLTLANPGLRKFVHLNADGEATIDYYNSHAIKALNKAILKAYYGITYWALPPTSLCPPIPGRADYIHYLSDLPLPNGESCKDKACHCLDIGVGSNCIYPIIGSREYAWTFVGSDIHADSLLNAKKIVTCNPVLAHQIELRLQPNPKHKFEDIILPGEYYDLTLCNPPFYDTAEQSDYQELTASYRKDQKQPLNFGGESNELYCEGGELVFLTDMMIESQRFAHQVGWFT